MPDALDRLGDALDRALDLDGDAREAFLATLDPALAADVRRALADDPLLDAPTAARAALADGAADGAADGLAGALSADAAAAEGARVGPYRLVSLLGEGGMGRVYRARRDDGAFDQTVAVKLVRRSLALAGADVAARLRRERDLLAALDHPGIARLLDGGETGDGVPYLVTELVDGEPITAYADGRGLGARARVGLLAEVARAVDHAHRRFVVHRDLKPSNVLVAEADGPGGAPVPRPVVLDFGIAKLLDEAEDTGTGAFPLTRTGMRLLTPAYAAPELFDPTLGVTVAADVYGLGALLYELLTGQRPHGDAPTAPTGEPTRPSKAAAPVPARALRGDLDTICLRALHPDPARRYGSAAELADDLDRFLDGRPVEARRDSLAYVAGRFARRNKAAVAAAAVALVGLVGGLGVALTSLAAERAARADAERSAAQATSASQMLLGIFEAANPELRDAGELSARDALDLALDEAAAVEDAPLRGYLLTMLGDAYFHLGEHARADSLLTAGVGLLDPAATPPLELGQALSTLARFRGAGGDVEAALGFNRRAHASALRAVREAGGDADRPIDPLDDRQLLLFGVTRDQAWLLGEAGDRAGAVAWAQRAVAMARAGGATERNWPHAYQELGDALGAEGRADEAIAAYREAVRLGEAGAGEAGRDSSALVYSRNGLALALAKAGQSADAVAALRDGVAAMRRLFGTQSLRVGEAMGNLGTAYLLDGQPRAAAPMLDSARAALGSVGLGEIPWVGHRAAELAWARTRLGDAAAAEAAARDALAIAEASDDATLRARARGHLGLALAAQGRRGDAAPHLRAGLAAAADAPADLLLAGELDAFRAALGG